MLSLRLAAEVKLPAIISGHMLIRQQMPVRIWGKAAAGEKVAVEMNGQPTSTSTDGSDAWEVFLTPMAAVVSGNCPRPGRADLGTAN
jgi:sialate O-acetylesterase